VQPECWDRQRIERTNNDRSDSILVYEYSKMEMDIDNMVKVYVNKVLGYESMEQFSIK
jgi:hypothetical protein